MMRLRDLDVLIVPGLGDSGPEHWQTRWQGRMPQARRLAGVDFVRPSRAEWEDALCAALETMPPARPIFVIAHSLGVIAVAHAARRFGPGRVVGAFLVAPPDDAALARTAEIDPDFRPPPSGPLPFPSLLIASRDDPYAAFENSEMMAGDWGSALIDAGAAGHINAASGHGPWPEGLLRLGSFLKRLCG